MATSNSDWEKLTNDFINEYGFTSKDTQSKILKKVNGFLQEKYKGKAPKAHIKNIAEDVTESICLKLNIPC